MAREEEVVFDRTNSLGEKMSRYAPGYADPTEPDPSWKGVGGGGVLRTPRKTKMKTYGAVGSDDGSRYAKHSIPPAFNRIEDPLVLVVPRPLPQRNGLPWYPPSVLLFFFF